MKIVRKDAKHQRYTLIAEDPDDLYRLYKVIRSGDSIESKTTRRIKRDDTTRSNESRELVHLNIKVEDVEFYGFGEAVRVRGKITDASDPHIALDSYHSINIKQFQEFSISRDGWQQEDLDLLLQTNIGTLANLLIVTLDASTALIYEVGTFATHLILELTPIIPLKSHSLQQHHTETLEFFKAIADFLKSRVQKDMQIVLAGPGFARENLQDYLKEHYPQLLLNLRNYATKSIGPSGILELFNSGNLSSEQLASKIAAKEAQIVQQFFVLLATNDAMVSYGIDELTELCKQGAIDTLVYKDNLLHTSIELREQIEQIAREVQQFGGHVLILSALHPSGEQLDAFGGIVALLRFPVYK